MDSVQEIMAQLLNKAKSNAQLKEEILATQAVPESLSAFCEICNREGYDISVMDIVDAGEEDYDLMRRSINGGGGNHNMLPGCEDPYEMLLTQLRMS